MQLISKNRTIDYLRFCITDKCNLRCRYCMPEQGVSDMNHYQILRVEEMQRIIRIFHSCGVKNLRITGGEPLVSKILFPLLHSISDIPLEDIGITTNGQRLSEMAQDLVDAGVKRVNISLDTLNAEDFKWITRGGDLTKTLAGIDAALAAGLKPVKLNTVAVRGFNDNQFVDLALMCKDRPLHLRFIELMPVGTADMWNESNFISAAEIKAILRPLGELKLIQVRGAGPAKNYNIEGFRGSIGFITAISEHFCNNCNRLRFTFDGKLYTCLHYDKYHDFLPLLRSNASDEEIVALIKQALEHKPLQHDLGSQTRDMGAIGG
jgi:cyclic pyranopterin phosphate synthase